MEIFPGAFTDLDVIYLIDIDDKKSFKYNKRQNKQTKLDYMDAYPLGLMPYFKHAETHEGILRYMCHYINEIDILEELKHIIKLCQILTARAIFTGDEQEELLEVIKMSSNSLKTMKKI